MTWLHPILCEIIAETCPVLYFMVKIIKIIKKFNFPFKIAKQQILWNGEEEEMNNAENGQSGYLYN